MNGEKYCKPTMNITWLPNGNYYVVSDPRNQPPNLTQTELVPNNYLGSSSRNMTYGGINWNRREDFLIPSHQQVQTQMPWKSPDKLQLPPSPTYREAEDDRMMVGERRPEHLPYKVLEESLFEDVERSLISIENMSSIEREPNRYVSSFEQYSLGSQEKQAKSHAYNEPLMDVPCMSSFNLAPFEDVAYCSNAKKKSVECKSYEAFGEKDLQSSHKKIRKARKRTKSLPDIKEKALSRRQSINNHFRTLNDILPYAVCQQSRTPRETTLEKAYEYIVYLQEEVHRQVIYMSSKQKENTKKLLKSAMNFFGASSTRIFYNDQPPLSQFGRTNNVTYNTNFACTVDPRGQLTNFRTPLMCAEPYLQPWSFYRSGMNARLPCSLSVQDKHVCYSDHQVTTNRQSEDCRDASNGASHTNVPAQLNLYYK